MKKRVLALLMAAVMILQLTGCRTKDTTAEGKETQTQNSIKDMFHSAKEDRADAAADVTVDAGTDEKDIDIPEQDERDTDEGDIEIRYQDDYYEFVNENLLSKIELAATDAHWDWCCGF